MFRWINKQGVESDEGFVVQVLDRFTAAYREGARAITVPVEFAQRNGRACVSVDPLAFARWDEDAPGAMISLEEQQEILGKFKGAFLFQNIEVIVEKGETGSS
jgi:hypothetical protein